MHSKGFWFWCIAMLAHFPKIKNENGKRKKEIMANEHDIYYSSGYFEELIHRKDPHTT